MSFLIAASDRSSGRVSGPSFSGISSFCGVSSVLLAMSLTAGTELAPDSRSSRVADSLKGRLRLPKTSSGDDSFDWFPSLLALEIPTARWPAKDTGGHSPAHSRHERRETFLRNHAGGIASMDLFVVPTISFRLLCGFLILRHSRRKLLWLGVTARPSAHWIARQLTKAYGWQQAPQYTVRDRDRVYGDVVIQRLRAMGIRDRPISPRSPWQNGYAERLIGSIRRDCLDHVVVFGERHLRHLLNCYQKYYNEARTHLSLHKDAPIPRAVQSVGLPLAMPVLGGLHHQYFRA